MPGLALALLAVVLVMGSPVAADTSAVSASKPKLTLVQGAPLTIRGSRFVPGERVRVMVVGGASKRVVASGGGAFVARFRNAAVDRCAGFTIRAQGSLGSRATLRSPPTYCPPRL